MKLVTEESRFIRIRRRNQSLYQLLLVGVLMMALGAMPGRKRANLRASSARTAYTQEEDTIIHQWAKFHGSPAQSPQGKTLWCQLEASGKLNRTWKSLKSRYQRLIRLGAGNDASQNAGNEENGFPVTTTIAASTLNLTAPTPQRLASKRQVPPTTSNRGGDNADNGGESKKGRGGVKVEMKHGAIELDDVDDDEEEEGQGEAKEDEEEEAEESGDYTKGSAAAARLENANDNENKDRRNNNGTSTRPPPSGTNKSARSKRKSYTEEDEIKIARFLMSYRLPNRSYTVPLFGTHLWVELSKTSLLDPPRTWQSLRNHFRRHLIKRLDEYIDSGKYTSLGAIEGLSQDLIDLRVDSLRVNGTAVTSVGSSNTDSKSQAKQAHRSPSKHKVSAGEAKKSANAAASAGAGAGAGDREDCEEKDSDTSDMLNANELLRKERKGRIQGKLGRDNGKNPGISSNRQRGGSYEVSSVQSGGSGSLGSLGSHVSSPNSGTRTGSGRSRSGSVSTSRGKFQYHSRSSSRRDSNSLPLSPPQLLSPELEDNDLRKSIASSRRNREKQFQDMLEDLVKNDGNVGAEDDAITRSEEMEKIIRQNWKEGDEIEIYSQSSSRWVRGVIKSITIEMGEEWIEVLYFNKRKRKQVQRFDKSTTRPIRQLQVPRELRSDSSRSTTSNNNRRRRHKQRRRSTNGDGEYHLAAALRKQDEDRERAIAGAVDMDVSDNSQNIPSRATVREMDREEDGGGSTSDAGARADLRTSQRKKADERIYESGIERGFNEEDIMDIIDGQEQGFLGGDALTTYINNNARNSNEKAAAEGEFNERNDERGIDTEARLLRTMHTERTSVVQSLLSDEQKARKLTRELDLDRGIVEAAAALREGRATSRDNADDEVKDRERGGGSVAEVGEKLIPEVLKKASKSERIASQMDLQDLRLRLEMAKSSGQEQLASYLEGLLKEHIKSCSKEAEDAEKTAAEGYIDDEMEDSIAKILETPPPPEDGFEQRGDGDDEREEDNGDGCNDNDATGRDRDSVEPRNEEERGVFESLKKRLFGWFHQPEGKQPSASSSSANRAQRQQQQHQQQKEGQRPTKMGTGMKLWSAALKRHILHRDYESVIKTFEQRETMEGIFPDEFFFNAALYAYVTAGRLSSGRRLLREMKDSSKTVYSMMTASLSAQQAARGSGFLSSSSPMAKNVSLFLRKVSGLSPCSFTVNGQLSSHDRNNAPELAKIYAENIMSDKAYVLLHELHSKRVRLTILPYKRVLKLCQRDLRLDIAMEVYKQIQEAHLRVDGEICHRMLSLCYRAGSPRLSHIFWEKMQEIGVAADSQYLLLASIPGK